VKSALGEIPPQVHPARCLAEAHLYLDMVGVGTTRSIQWKEGPQGRVLLATGMVEEEGPETFGFTLDDPEGALGKDGVAAPSRMLEPSAFLLYADILAKRSPAGASLTAAERAVVVHDLELAATCIEEVMKFIPAGEELVPASEFRSVAARRVVVKEPGRFRRPRLEVVAKTYRDIAARSR
jgi:hypothetical protein